jgi:hypothetical protein
VTGVWSAGHAHGCPKCGSDILRSAPLPIVGPLVKPFVEKRRYRCRQCDWTGWRHRLHRRNSALPSSGGSRSVDRRAIWFFIVVVLFIVATAIMLIRMWSANLPYDPVQPPM